MLRFYQANKNDTNMWVLLLRQLKKLCVTSFDRVIFLSIQFIVLNILVSLSLSPHFFRSKQQFRRNAHVTPPTNDRRRPNYHVYLFSLYEYHLIQVR